MFKYAFIEEAEGASPENYSFTYENSESCSFVAGVNDMDMAEELVKKLDQEGYELIDLCGAFDDERAQRRRKAVKGDMEILHVNYFPEEQKKLDALDSFKEFGVVIVMDGVEDTQKFELRNEECNTYVRFTKDLEAAKAAAKELTDQGVYFIEICSYFDEEKTRAIIDAVGGKVPVGSCGI